MCASGVRLTGWMRPRMSPSGREPSLIARLSSRWPGCFAGSRSPRLVTGSGSEAGVPFNRKRGSLSGQGNHAALRMRWSSGRLKPMDKRCWRRATVLWDVRYGLADGGGALLRKGLNFRAEGQLSLISGMRRRPGWPVRPGGRNSGMCACRRSCSPMREGPRRTRAARTVRHSIRVVCRPVLMGEDRAYAGRPYGLDWIVDLPAVFMTAGAVPGLEADSGCSRHMNGDLAADCSSGQTAGHILATKF